ncbi:MAG: DUF4386 family protein [Aeromicrobium sp.]
MKRSGNLVTAALLVAGAVIVNVAFVGLGSAFDYPDVLGRPAGEVLEMFAQNEVAVIGWFAVLAFGAGLLGPIALHLGRLSELRSMRWAVRAGVAAAVVQVVGLARWVVIVPWLSERASEAQRAGDTTAAASVEDTFVTVNRVLGMIIGETFGYTLTAAWTLLVIFALRPQLPAWLRLLGIPAAILIAAGLLVPLDVPGMDQANFVGYVLWSVWLVALAMTLVRSQSDDKAEAEPMTHDAMR